MLAQTRHQRVLSEQQRFQGGDDVGQVGWGEHVPSLCKACNVYKADVGFQVRSGCRQSTPSSSIDSCACVSATEPLVACGQMKCSRSSRLANRHKPSSLHHSNLMRSPRRPRNTNTPLELQRVLAILAACIRRYDRLKICVHNRNLWTQMLCPNSIMNDAVRAVQTALGRCLRTVSSAKKSENPLSL